MSLTWRGGSNMTCTMLPANLKLPMQVRIVAFICVHIMYVCTCSNRSNTQMHTHAHTHTHRHTHLGASECPEHLQQLSLCFPIDPFHDAEHLLNLTLLNMQTHLLKVSEHLQAGGGGKVTCTARHPWIKEWEGLKLLKRACNMQPGVCAHSVTSKSSLAISGTAWPIASRESIRLNKCSLTTRLSLVTREQYISALMKLPNTKHSTATLVLLQWSHSCIGHTMVNIYCTYVWQWCYVCICMPYKYNYVPGDSTEAAVGLGQLMHHWHAWLCLHSISFSPHLARATRNLKHRANSFSMTSTCESFLSSSSSVVASPTVDL